MIRPFSGAINTFMFVFVASVTLFFERVWKIYEQIAADKAALQEAHAELLHLNQNLERHRAGAIAGAGRLGATVPADLRSLAGHDPGDGLPGPHR